MNELNDIVKKLADEYGSGLHWQVTKAVKTEHGWELIVSPAKEEKGGRK